MANDDLRIYPCPSNLEEGSLMNSDSDEPFSKAPLSQLVTFPDSLCSCTAAAEDAEDGLETREGLFRPCEGCQGDVSLKEEMKKAEAEGKKALDSYYLTWKAEKEKVEETALKAESKHKGPAKKSTKETLDYHQKRYSSQ